MSLDQHTTRPRQGDLILAKRPFHPITRFLAKLIDRSGADYEPLCGIVIGVESNVYIIASNTNTDGIYEGGTIYSIPRSYTGYEPLEDLVIVATRQEIKDIERVVREDAGYSGKIQNGEYSIGEPLDLDMITVAFTQLNTYTAYIKSGFVLDLINYAVHLKTRLGTNTPNQKLQSSDVFVRFNLDQVPKFHPPYKELSVNWMTDPADPADA